MGEFRLSQLGEQIREEISSLIVNQKIKDPRVSPFLSINSVVVSSDLSYAKVYVSSFLDKHKTKQGVRGLENATGFISSTISKKLRIRQFPQLTFIYGTSIEQGIEMVNKIQSLNISAPEPEDERSAIDEQDE